MEDRPVARIGFSVINGRRVTTVRLGAGFAADLETLAETLGGLLNVHAETARGFILLPGDHRERLRRELKHKGYRVRG